MLVPAVAFVVSACGLSAETAAPGCADVERLAAVAQSVPSAAYLPCLQALPPGWRVDRFDVRSGSSSLSLLSDRSAGRPVEVRLSETCDVRGASPAAPRAAGVRSYVRVRSVAPTYAGTRYDVFAGGCVASTFAFPRGPHIPLLEELSSSVGLLARRDLRVQVRQRLGVELDP